MKKYIQSIPFFVLLLSACKAQNTFPMNTFPAPNGSYIKDFDNELNPYIGIWNTDFNGKRITITITKELKKRFKQPDLTSNHFRDALIIKYSVDEIFKSGSTLHIADNFDATSDESNNFIASFAVIEIGVKFYYTGTNCGVGYGEIILKQKSSNQFNWSFHPVSTIITTENCPPNSDVKIHLPVTDKLIFTKQ